MNESESQLGVDMHDTNLSWTIIISFFLIFIGAGGLLNFANVLALIGCKRNGTLSFILQISLVDCFSIHNAAIEIFSLKKENLSPAFGSCQLFMACEIFLNCLTSYLLVCLNFHALALWNLHEIETKKSTRNPLTSNDPDEYLLTRQENTNRLVTIDYRKRKSDISSVLPAIFVWLVSFSLSIPSYIFSSTLEICNNYSLCAVIDSYYGPILQYALLVFAVIIPNILLISSFLIITIKLYQSSQKDIDRVLTKKFHEIRSLLIFTIILSIAYILTSFQRKLLHFLHTIMSDKENKRDSFKIPPLYNMFLNNSAIVCLSMLHYGGLTLRPVLYLGFLPKFRCLLRSKIFCTDKNDQ